MEMVCDGRGVCMMSLERYCIEVLGKILYRHNVVGGGVYLKTVIYGGAM